MENLKDNIKKLENKNLKLLIEDESELDNFKEIDVFQFCIEETDRVING